MPRESVTGHHNAVNTHDIDNSAGPIDGNKTAHDFLSLIKQGIEDSLSSRITELEAQIDALTARLDGGESAGGSPSDDSDESINERIKSEMTQVFIDSGLLEALVRRIVDRKLESRDGGGGDSCNANELRQQSGAIVKEFLSQNLGKIFQKEIGSVVEDSIAKFLSGERVKALIDDKFRAVTLYMKTEVIPKAVEKVLSETP
jgi:hypothetical protein